MRTSIGSVGFQRVTVRRQVIPPGSLMKSVPSGSTPTVFNSSIGFDFNPIYEREKNRNAHHKYFQFPQENRSFFQFPHAIAHVLSTNVIPNKLKKSEENKDVIHTHALATVLVGGHFDINKYTIPNNIHLIAHFP